MRPLEQYHGNTFIGSDEITGKVALQVGGVKVWEAANDGSALTLLKPTDMSAALSGDIAVDSSGVVTLAETVIRSTTVSIASADITGTSAGQLGHANGYPLVAAQGAHKVIELVSAVVINAFAVAAYTGGGNVSVNYEAGGAALSGTATFANSIGGSANKIAVLLPAVPTNNQLAENKGLNLVVASAPTQPGTAAGVLRVKVAYRVHTTGL